MIYNILSLMALAGVIYTLLVYRMTKKQLSIEFAKPRLEVALFPIERAIFNFTSIFVGTLIPNIIFGNIFWWDPNDFVSGSIALISFIILLPFALIVNAKDVVDDWFAATAGILLIIFISFALRVV